MDAGPHVETPRAAPCGNPDEQQLALLARIRMVATLADALVHDLSGPLQTLVNCDFLMRRALAATPDAPRALAAPIGWSSEQHERMRAQFAALSELPRAVRAPNLAAVPVRGWLDAALERLPEARAAEVELPAHVERLSVLGDAEQLGLALGALLRNALEFAPAGTAPRVAVESRGGAVACRVQNVSAATWPAAPGTACDPLFTTKPRCLGLGLSVAFAVALGHGGRLELGAARPGVVEARLELGVWEGGS